MPISGRISNNEIYAGQLNLLRSAKAQRIAIVEIKNSSGYESTTKFKKLLSNNPSQVATERSIIFRASAQSTPIEFKLPKEAFGKELNIGQQGKIYDNAIDALALCDRIKESGSKNISRSDLNKLCSYYDKLKGNLEDGSPVLKEIFSTFDSIIDQSLQKGNQLNQTNDLYAAMEFATNSISASEATPSNMKELKSYIEGKITETCRNQIESASNLNLPDKFQHFNEIYNAAKNSLPKDSPEFKEISSKIEEDINQIYQDATQGANDTAGKLKQLDDIYNAAKSSSTENSYVFQKISSKTKEDINQIYQDATQGTSDTAGKLKQLDDIYNAAKSSSTEDSYVLQEISPKIKENLNQIYKDATQGVNDTAGKLQKLGDIYNTAKSSLPKNSHVFQEISSNVKKDTNQILTKIFERYDEIKLKPGNNFSTLQELAPAIETGAKLLCDNLDKDPSNATLEDVQLLSCSYACIVESSSYGGDIILKQQIQSTIEEAVKNVLEKIKQNTNNPSEQLDQINHFSHYAENTFGSLSTDFESLLPTIKEITLSACKNLSNNINNIELKDVQSLSYAYQTFTTRLSDLQFELSNLNYEDQDLQQEIKELSSALQEIQSTFESAVSSIYDNEIKNNNPETLTENLTELWNITQDTQLESSQKLKEILIDIDAKITQQSEQANSNLSFNKNENDYMLHFDDIEEINVRDYSDPIFEESSEYIAPESYDYSKLITRDNDPWQQLDQLQAATSSPEQINTNLNTLVPQILENIKKDTDNLNQINQLKNLYDTVKSINAESTTLSDILSEIKNPTTEILKYVTENMDNLSDSTIKSLNYAENMNSLSDNSIAVLAGFYSQIQSIDPNSNQLPKIADTIEKLTQKICENINKTADSYKIQFSALKSLYDNVKLNGKDSPALKLILSNMQNAATEMCKAFNDLDDDDDWASLKDVQTFQHFHETLVELSADQSVLDEIISTTKKIIPQAYTEAIYDHDLSQFALSSELVNLQNIIKNLSLENSPELQDTLSEIDLKIKDLNKQQDELLSILLPVDDLPPLPTLSPDAFQLTQSNQPQIPLIPLDLPPLGEINSGNIFSLPSIPFPPPELPTIPNPDSMNQDSILKEITQFSPETLELLSSNPPSEPLSEILTQNPPIAVHTDTDANKQTVETPQTEQPLMPPPPQSLNTAMPQPPVINSAPSSSHTTIPTSADLPHSPSTGLPPPPTISKSVQEIKFQPIPNQSSSTGLPPPPELPESVKKWKLETKQPIKYSSNDFPLPPEPPNLTSPNIHLSTSPNLPLPPEPLNIPLSSENNTPPLNTN